MTALDERGAQVLRHVVEDYIETAEPVGSRTISKRMGQRLSPATIRNIMADLEETGYLAQPHTSAGRIPTGAGFRYYVDYLLARRQLARGEREQLTRGEREQLTRVAGEGVASVEEFVRQTSRLLSNLSRQACVVVVSRTAHQPLRSLNLVRASSDRILLMAVLEGGWVEHRLIEDERDLTGDDLSRINACLNELAAGLTLPRLRERILQEMHREKARYDRLMKKALSLSAQALSAGDPQDVFIEGRVNILDKPEFAEDVGKLKRILRAFEEKSVMVRLLDMALDGGAVQVSIGAENPVEELTDLSVVASSCRLGRQAIGGIGVVGPVRMDYSRVITLVEHAARLLNSIYEER